jgi:hypothetical protein
MNAIFYSIQLEATMSYKYITCNTLGNTRSLKKKFIISFSSLARSKAQLNFFPKNKAQTQRKRLEVQSSRMPESMEPRRPPPKTTNLWNRIENTRLFYQTFLLAHHIKSTGSYRRPLPNVACNCPKSSHFPYSLEKKKTKPKLMVKT